jgi:predicted TIM-barrel fold metal-dependent hydrolase
MMPLEKVKEYLDRITRVAAEGVLSDMHVHPFEVMSSDIQYRKNNKAVGVYSTDNSPYEPPVIGPLPERTISKNEKPVVKAELKKKMTLLQARRLYTHTGPAVLGDHMAISGVSRMLLLPVAGHGESGFKQMELMMDMFGDDGRYSFGFCVPSDTPEKNVSQVVGVAMDRYKIIALKIHPNISGIDLSKTAGVKKVESFLQASRDHGLSVVVHGGLSPDLFQDEFTALATMDNLKQVDWDITDQTVVIAHAGCFGYSAAQADRDVLPELDSLLGRHDHLVVDTSGINADIIKLVLTRVDLDRILFGSDALYFPTWLSLVRLLSILDKCSSSSEEILYRLAGTNVKRRIFDS